MAEQIDTRGMHDKFQVARTDGQSAPGRKHDGCRYFVLDLDHDEHAPVALRTYADSARDDRPVLARDLDALAGSDAWLAEHDRQVAAQALRDAADHAEGMDARDGTDAPVDPREAFVWATDLRERADSLAPTLATEAAHAATVDALSVSAEQVEEAPEIVVLCGSTRFRDEMTAANRDLTLAGCIVLAPGVFGHSGDVMTDAQKVALDALHRRKIDLADRVLVVSPSGYIGDSTRSEIRYARRARKPVAYTDPPRIWQKGEDDER